MGKFKVELDVISHKSSLMKMNKKNSEEREMTQNKRKFDEEQEQKPTRMKFLWEGRVLTDFPFSIESHILTLAHTFASIVTTTSCDTYSIQHWKSLLVYGANMRNRLTENREAHETFTTQFNSNSTRFAS